MAAEEVSKLIELAPLISTVTIAGVAGWVITTWMRVRHGYPLDGAWGQAIYPKTSTAEQERIRLLSQENAQLRAELGSVKDRLGNVERIVTDRGYQLTNEIEALRASDTKAPHTIGSTKQ